MLIYMPAPFKRWRDEDLSGRTLEILYCESAVPFSETE